jgi:predicted ATPase
VNTGASRRGGGRRERGHERREHVVKVKYSKAEKASLSAAAEQVSMAVAAYLGQVGLDAAENRAMPVPMMYQKMLAELLRASGIMRRAGVNLNQAVARLNATGVPGPDLEPAAAYCMQVARHLDEAAELVRRKLH